MDGLHDDMANGGEVKVDPVTKDHDDRCFELVVINVGGVVFKTNRRTLNARPECRLADYKFMKENYNIGSDEYYFDRDPDMFKATLNYLRTGELHLPSFICGPAAKKELEFWGISPSHIERCCWINYNEWNSTQEALKRLENDRKMNMPSLDFPANRSCAKWRHTVWRILNRSNSSVTAKIVGLISLFFVVSSIFSFLAETTKPFEYFPESLQASNYTEQRITTAGIINVSEEIASDTANDTNTKPMNEQLRIKHPVLQVIDMICLTYFTLEYITRFICAPKKLKYATSLISIIDFLAILPDFIEIIIYNARPDLKNDVEAVHYITILRVIRVLRIFRLLRHSAGLWLLVYTLRASFSELMLLVWFMGIGVLVFSSLIYFVEERENFESIPNGFWWSLITMTTVGYGDMYPRTTLGKLVGSLCAMSGVLMIGFTVPALVNNFMLYYRHIQFAIQVEDLDSAFNEENAGTTEANNRSKYTPDIVVESTKNGRHEFVPLVAVTDKL